MKCWYFGMHLLASLTLLPLMALWSAPPAKKEVRQSVTRNVTATEVEDTSKNDPIAKGAAGSLVIRAQILLDRARFSPGQIDGRYGGDLEIAIKGYQEKHGLPPTGTVNAEMWKLLMADTGDLLTTYTITAADVKGPFQDVPKDVQQQATMKSLGYESVEEKLGEKFHISPKLLAQLNPGKKLDTAGEQITVPNVQRGPARRASRVVVSKTHRTVTAYGLKDRVLAQYPATIGGPHDPLPIGSWKITVVQRNPWFLYNPERFWNVDQTKSRAKLPPGPNNPAGVVWMGLSKPHYGIHGSPEPGQIRHDTSYGCIRLTNWDADDLARMVRPGTPALLEE